MNASTPTYNIILRDMNFHSERFLFNRGKCQYIKIQQSKRSNLWPKLQSNLRTYIYVGTMLIKSVHFSFFFLLPNTPNILMSAILLFFAISDKNIISHKCSRNTYYSTHLPFDVRNKFLMLGEEWNLNDKGIRKAINGHYIYLTFSVINITLHDECTWH